MADHEPLHVGGFDATDEPAAFRVTGRTGTVTVECRGELDRASRPLLRSALTAALGRGPSHLVVDLSGVTSFDREAVAELARAEERISASGGSMTLLGLSRFDRRALGEVGSTIAAEPESRREARRRTARAAGPPDAAPLPVDGPSLDPLTGLASRREAVRALDVAVARARERDLPVTVVLVEIDDLRRTNELFGRTVGDRSLAQLADALAAVLPAPDHAYRFGGAEFLLVLPDRDLAAVAPLVEQTAVDARTAFTWGCAGLPADGADAPEAELLLTLAARRVRDQRAGAVDRRVWTEARRLAGTLQTSGRDRFAIEQATGMVAEHFGLPIDAALALLLGYAERHDAALSVVAAQVVERQVGTEELFEPVVESDATRSAGAAGIERAAGTGHRS